MSEPQVGDRVFAIESSDRESILLYGFGVYEGDFPRPEVTDRVREEVDKILLHDAEEFFGKPRDAFDEDEVRQFNESVADIHKRMEESPRIRLDDGQVVWGFQCWWGPEAIFDLERGMREVVNVPVPKIPVIVFPDDQPAVANDDGMPIPKSLGLVDDDGREVVVPLSLDNGGQDSAGTLDSVPVGVAGLGHGVENPADAPSDPDASGAIVEGE